MRVTCIAASELDDRLVQRWHEFQSHPDRPEWLHPFLSAAFFQLTAQIRDRARLAVIEDAGHVVGLWAFESPLRGLALPLARHMSDLQGVLFDPNWASDGGLQSFAHQSGLHVVRFDHLLPSRREGWRESPAPVGSSMMVTTRTRWMIQLDQGFETYRREQMPQTRWWRRAPGKAHKLAKAMGPLVWQDDVRDDAAWLSLARWKSAQYRASGLRDNFSIGWVRQWLERLRWADSPSLSGSLQSLRAGGQLVAVHFGLRGHHILHHYLPAYEHDLAMHSPGSVLLEQTIAQAPVQGATLIDLSTGDMDYKQAVSNHQEQLDIGAIGPASLLHLQAMAHQTAAYLRRCPGLLPAARRGRRALVNLLNGASRHPG